MYFDAHQIFNIRQTMWQNIALFLEWPSNNPHYLVKQWLQLLKIHFVSIHPTS